MGRAGRVRSGQAWVAVSCEAMGSHRLLWQGRGKVPVGVHVMTADPIPLLLLSPLELRGRRSLSLYMLVCHSLLITADKLCVAAMCISILYRYCIPHLPPPPEW
jgi:hypothetical protein